jgi:hypothetical protein
MGLMKILGISTGKEKKLMETGVALNGVIAQIIENTAVTVNGRHPLKLLCEATLPTGEIRYFESGNVSKNTHPSVVGQPIRIYLDPTNPKNYYVDAAAYK